MKSGIKRLDACAIAIVLLLACGCITANAQIIDTLSIHIVDPVPTGERLFVVGLDPKYPGGMEKLFAYLDSAIVYPRRALRRKIGGRVILSFVVEANGNLTNFKAFRSPDQQLTDECIRVMTPVVFNPGKQPSGQIYRSAYVFTINFDVAHPKEHFLIFRRKQ